MSSPSSTSISSSPSVSPAKVPSSRRASSSASAAKPSGAFDACNLAVVRGTLSSDPVERVLDNGDRLLILQVTTRGEHGQTSVPVVWRNPPAAAGKLTAGTPVVASGPVVRRFFGPGGVTQTRVEVVAERVVPVRSARAVRSLLARAVATLEVTLGSSG